DRPLDRHRSPTRRSSDLADERLPDALGRANEEGPHSARRRRTRPRVIRQAARLYDSDGRFGDVQNVRQEIRYPVAALDGLFATRDRKSTRLNSSHQIISY